MKNILLKTTFFVFLTFLSSVSFGQLCYANLEGTYNALTINEYDDWCLSWNPCEGNEWQGSIRIENSGIDSIYNVYSTDDSLGIEFNDMLFGLFYTCSPYATDQSQFPNGNLVLRQSSCNTLSINGTDQWGESYSISEPSIDSTGKVLKFRLIYNDYCEGGNIELTRTDDLLWTDGTTSISKTELSEKQLDIFPNPVNDILHLKTEEDLTNAQIFIINIHGKVMLQRTITSPTIDLSSFERGIYFIEINDLEDGELWVKKIIVE